MRQRFERRSNSPAWAGSIRRYAALAAAVSVLAVGMAVSAPSASAVMQVGDQGWYAWAADYAISLPFVSGATYAAGTNPWNPQALIDVGTNNTWRFMVWDCCNNNENVAWADRKLPTNTDQSAPWFAGEWVWNGSAWVDTGTPPAKGQGMAYEWMVDLCNRTNTNMWINIPHKASDDYVTKLAQLIRFGSNGTTPYTSTQSNPTWAPLNSNLKVYIEYSNEVWNTGFDQNHWAGVQAAAQGLPDNLHYYGRRVVQVDNLFYTVWSGSTSRLVRVLGAQCDNITYVEDQEMAQVTADGGTIDALAVAPYWDVGDGASPNYLANANAAITSQLANIDVHKAWANSHGVSLVSYEGGMGCETNADQARRNANNFSLYQTFLDGCQSHGVALMNLYAHVGTPGTSNAWGAKEFWAQATSASPSWNGITTWIANHPGSGNGGGVPSAPTGLTATAGNAQVALSWTASSGATSYNVYRGTTSGGESGTAIATGIATASYTNTGLTNGTTYFFTVKAVNSAGTSGASNEASATPTSGGTSGPVKINAGGPAVSPFVADVDFSGGLTATNWTGTIDTSAVTSPAPQAVYQSERYASSPVTYTIGGLTSGTTYTVRLHFCENYYTASAQRVFSVSINGTTVLTNYDIYAAAGAAHKANIQQFNAAANGSGQEVIAFTNVTNDALVNGIEVNTVSAPPAPTGLTATAGNTQVALSWTASSGATNYNVLRSTVSGSGYASVATGIATTSYTNTGLTNGTTYYFVVTATNAGGTSGNSNQASATPQVAAPPAPTGLTATPGNAQVALSWTASSGATSYNVYRGTAAGGESGTAIATGIATTSYTNTGLANGTHYYFTVKAVNAGGTSGASNEASATPSSGATLPIQINAGGPAASPFVADVDFSGGLTATNWTGTINTSGVTNPAPQAVYQSERYASSPITYTIPGLTPGTTYTVRLHFCENYYTASAQRVFSVSINGTTVLTNFDIYATAGAAHKANIQQFNVAANSSGQEVIAFTNVTNDALINGIEVTAASGSGNTHTGTWAMKGVFTTTATWNNSAEVVNVSPSQTYVASFWMKGAGAVVLRVANGSWGTEITRQTFTATANWTQYQITGIATGSNTQLTYDFTDGGGVAGTAYFDDCFFGVANGTNTLTNAGFESGNTVWTIGAPFSIVQNP